MKILLDTNAYAAWKRGNSEMSHRIRRAERIYLSAVVAGELLFGFRNGTRFKQNLAELETFLESPYVTFVPVTLVTADRFGLIAASLRTRRTPIPTNDIWIAAHAMETGADLLSFDRHFQRVDGLVWVDLSE